MRPLRLAVGHGVKAEFSSGARVCTCCARAERCRQAAPFLGELPLRAASQARQPAMRVRRRPHAAGGGAVSVAAHAGGGAVSVAAHCLWPHAAGGGAVPVAAQCPWRRSARGGALPVAAHCPCPRPARARALSVPVPCPCPRIVCGRALSVAAHCPCPRTSQARPPCVVGTVRSGTPCGRADGPGDQAVTRHVRRAGRHAAASEASRSSPSGRRPAFRTSQSPPWPTRSAATTTRERAEGRPDAPIRMRRSGCADRMHTGGARSSNQQRHLHRGVSV
jgi:hypothetical protein